MQAGERFGQGKEMGIKALARLQRVDRRSQRRARLAEVIVPSAGNAQPGLPMAQRQLGLLMLVQPSTAAR